MTKTSTARKFKPIFIATVTPSDVQTREGKDGSYTVMQGATVSPKGKKAKTMTVMAFGNSRARVNDALQPGQTVELAVQHYGNTLKIIGFPREKTF